MNAIIHKILIFGSSTEVRQVQFEAGLNIITGDSKTGKSTLIEIVDYCFFSTRSTIPKGIIDDFGELFAIVLKLSKKYISIARPNFKTSKRGIVYLKIETNDRFLENLSKDYFTSLEEKNLKDAQVEVEKHLGLSVQDTRLDFEDDKRNAGKVTLRSMASFLFQHQNIVANKHSIFYRFDDINKRNKTIADYPILIGWANDEYFQTARELELKKKQLKAELRFVEKQKMTDEQLLENLRTRLSSYYVFIGKELEENLDLKELKKLSENLPRVSMNSFSDSNIQREIESLNQQRFELQDKLSEKEILLSQSSITKDLSNSYIDRLHRIDTVLDKTSNKKDILKCPVCENDVTENLQNVVNLIDSRKKLYEELSKIETYKNDKTGQIEFLQNERDTLKRKINKLSIEIQKLEDQDGEFQKNKSLIEQANILKGETKAKIERLLEQNSLLNGSSELEELNAAIAILQEKLAGYDLDQKIKKEEVYLSKRMTEICNKLDFEKELKPGKLQFDFKDFTFYYHFNEIEKISLSEMGSGANWLACHLSIFIALLNLNCVSKGSSIPAFLMIDQPSQVYFPRAYKKEDNLVGNVDENIKQVKNIFKVIEAELKIIKKACGFMPQIIVMDHADEPEFEPFIRKRWKKEGDKLI